MPWHVAKSDSCPSSKPWAVIKDSDSSVVACHESEESANEQLGALYASEEERQMGDDRMTLREAWQKVKDVVGVYLDADAAAARSREARAEQFRDIGMMRVQEQIWSLLQEGETWAWPIDVYIGADWIYTLVARDGKLYRIDLYLEEDGEQVRLGEWVQVTESHPPVEQRMIVRQQADGRWRWLNISASAVLNRVGEIDSKALFDNMARRAEESGEYPYRTFYHQGEAFQIGQADLLARDGALYITSGIFDDNPLAQAVVRAVQDEPDYWGDSIGYLPVGEPERVEVAEGVEVPVYSDGVHREISTLPEQNAASLFTMPSVQQEVSRMNPNVLEALERLRDKHGLDQEAIDELVELADQTNRGIDDEDLIMREGEAEQEAEEPTEDQEPESETPDDDPQEQETEETEDLEVELDEDAVDAIVDRVAESAQFTEIKQLLVEVQASITEQVDRGDQQANLLAEIDGRLADLERDEEEKQREWLEDQPRRRRVIVSHRPREANKDRTKNGDKSPEGSLADEAEATLDGMPQY